MAGLILRVRHSPGMKRREAARGASETRCEADSSVRELSCSLPLQRQVHAVCQRGASSKMRALPRFLLRFETGRNSGKAHTISVLLLFDFRDSRSQWNTCAAVVILC